MFYFFFFFFSSRRRHTRLTCDWSSDVCSSDLLPHEVHVLVGGGVEDDRGAVLREHLAHPLALLAVGEHRDRVEHVAVLDRSEERRVGKECRSRGSPYQ